MASNALHFQLSVGSPAITVRTQGADGPGDQRRHKAHGAEAPREALGGRAAMPSTAAATPRPAYRDATYQS